MLFDKIHAILISLNSELLNVSKYERIHKKTDVYITLRTQKRHEPEIYIGKFSKFRWLQCRKPEIVQLDSNLSETFHPCIQ